MALPGGFIDLSAASKLCPEQVLANVIGTVVDIQPPTTTRKDQYMCTFKLLDEGLRGSLYGSQGLNVRFFKPTIQSLPQVRNHGDVVLLRNIKMTVFSEQPMAISNYSTGFLVFPVDAIPSPSYQLAYQDTKRLDCLGVPQDVQKLTLEEQAYVIQLKERMSSTINSLPEARVPVAANPAATMTDSASSFPANAPAGPAAMRKRPGEELQLPEAKMSRHSSFGPKYRKISAVRHYDFADLCAQVVKKFPTQFGTCELYVTDYTENKDMFQYLPPEADSERDRDGDEYGYSGGTSKKQWPGPYGHLVLKVNVKTPHAEYANREVQEGEFVHLQNVKMKAMGNGMGSLEGDMWPDPRWPEKVQISKLKRNDIHEIEAILERKERYWSARNAKLGVSNEAEGQKKLTKSERRKQKKAEKAERAAGTNTITVAPKTTLSTRTAADTNPHIRCGNGEVRTSSFREILDPENKRHTNTLSDGKDYTLPFINAKFRAQVRVVDFEPKNLEDFAVPSTSDNAENSDNESVAMVDYDSSPHYEWSFSLLLEDSSSSKQPNSAPDRIWVDIGHAEAQYLFGNDVSDPVDLRTNRKLLAKVKEKLCILWGNLEERAAEEVVSNLPFECCLLEYGVEVDEDGDVDGSGFLGYQRMYRMFGVTIS